MPDIFISYDRRDLDAAGMLASHFGVRGWSVWWDQSIAVGEDYASKIQSALKASGCVVVLWSSRSVESIWVREEAKEGWERGVLIPVAIEKAKLPLPFTALQTIDLSDWKVRSVPLGLVSLLSAIESKFPLPGTPRLPVSSPLSERPDPEYEIGKALFRDAHFVAALSSFRNVVRRNADNSEARYYLVLCALSGRRPKLLRTERVAEIEVHLREALATAKGDSTHIRYLWAIIRYDCYTFNGLREPEPTTQELLAGGMQLDSLRAGEIMAAIAAPGNPVWESVFVPINSRREDVPHRRA